MKKSLITLGFSIFFSAIVLTYLFAQPPPEQITITTYYPSPFGSYNALRANRLVVDPTRAMPDSDGRVNWGDHMGALIDTDANGATIRLGGAGAPSIYFYNDMPADVANYDASIRLDDDHRISFRGVRVGTIDGRTEEASIPSSSDNVNDGNAYFPGCIRYTFTANSGHIHCHSGYQIAVAPFSPSSTSGHYLCCQTQ